MRLFLLILMSGLMANASLPTCVKNKADLEAIVSVMQKNKDTKLKYDGYRKFLAGDSDQDLTARLIYAETLASNCPKNRATVLPLIAGAIQNRIKLRKGDVKSVVFERNQFASSLNFYDSSKYLDFLCPTDSELWKNAVDTLNTSSTLSKTAVNYFLYKHHPGWDKEPWTLPEAELSKSVNVRDCIRVFDNKGWK